ncbi:MAG: hypothetical protein ACAI35_01285 [Candidatus Methylacidiphilales bacterium]|nr:hypothetical protein [Candidatus Methylacidiphilales bacterium]
MLLAFMAYGSLWCRASGESRLAAEAPEVAREVTFRIEGSVPKSSLIQTRLSVGSKTALITVLSVMVFGMLVLLRKFDATSHFVPQSACVVGLTLLAFGGVASVCTLMGHPRFRLNSIAGASQPANEVSDSNYKSVYIAVVEGEGSPSHHLNPGNYFLLHTALPKDQELPRGSRLSIAVDVDITAIKENLEDASSSTAAAH